MATRASFHEYLRHITPLVFFDVLIRHVALRIFRRTNTPGAALTRAITLVYATWPIYLFAWMMAVLRLPIRFQSTPKDIKGGMNPVWLLPQILALVSLVGGILYTVIVAGHPISLLLAFAMVQGILQLLLLVRWLHFEFTMRRNTPRPIAEVKQVP
jgi:hypothetical protein